MTDVIQENVGAAPDSTENQGFVLPEELRAYADSLRKDNAGTQDDLDKTLITLSTATVGVLLTLRQQIAGSTGLGFSWIFWAGVLSLFACVASVLLSHFASLRVNNRIVMIVEGLEAWDETTHRVVVRAQQGTRWVRLLNGGSALCFALGFAFSVWYVITITN